jgi:hypothetical protein
MPRPVHPAEAWADAYALTREARRANARIYTHCRRAFRTALPFLFVTDDILRDLETLERRQMAEADGISFIDRPDPNQMVMEWVA